jgi:hypothetical protein
MALVEASVFAVSWTTPGRNRSCRRRRGASYGRRRRLPRGRPDRCSPQRLGIDSIDIAFVHDRWADNKYLPTPYPEQFAIAQKGAFPELTRMREEGLIKG